MSKGFLSAMRQAVIKGDLKSAQNFVAQSPEVLTHTQNGKSWVHIAAQQDRPAMIQWLTFMGLGVNAVSTNGCTPLWLAPCEDAPFETIEMLLKVGADPNVFYGGQPFLHKSLVVTKKSSILVLVDLLLKHGADVHAYSKRGYTALHHAAARDLSEVALILMAAGADPYMKTRELGSNALEIARMWPNSRIQSDMLAWIQARQAQSAIQNLCESSALTEAHIPLLLP